MVLHRKPVVKFQHALDLVCRVEYLKWEVSNNCPQRAPCPFSIPIMRAVNGLNHLCFDEIVGLVLVDFGDSKSKIQTFAIFSFDVSIRKNIATETCVG